MDNILNETSNEYVLLTKNANDILDDMNLSEDNRLLYKSIISSLETNVAEHIKKGDIVNIPNVGRIRKNPIQQAMVKHYDELRTARRYMNKEEYKNYAREIVVDAKNKDTILQSNKKIIRKLKSKHNGTYDYYAKHFGIVYANLYIKSILWLKEVPFIQEVQDAFDNIK